MYIVTQDSNMRSNYLDMEYDQILASGHEFQSYGIIPFSGVLTGLIGFNEPDFVVRGSVSVLDRALTNVLTILGNPELEHAFKSKIYYSEGFSYKNYLNIGLPLINGKAELKPLSEILETKYDVPFFVKPADDQKEFDFTFVNPGENLQDSLYFNRTPRDYSEILCIVNTDLKDIAKEARFFVVGGEVVTGSYYQINKSFNRILIKDDEKIFQVAKAYAKLYQPHDNFVMDIAELADGSFEIVEYNCLNCSGLYNINSKALFDALKSYHEYT